LNEFGALPRQALAGLIEAGRIKGIDTALAQPASLDLPVSEEWYRVNSIFLPRTGEPVRDCLARLDAQEHSVGTILERGVNYLSRVAGEFAFVPSVYGYTNPKSTTGRTDVHVRVVADGVPSYDSAAPAGWKGELWLLVTPKSFPVLVPVGTALAQLRLCNHNTKLARTELELEVERRKLLWTLAGETIHCEDQLVRVDEGSLVLTVNLSGETIGWECLEPSTTFDFGAPKGTIDPSEFFVPLIGHNGSLRLREGRFYILSTREAVRVPPELACEMRPLDPRWGELRTHYAGFIDPGWGWGKKGEGKGRPITLEVRPFENMTLTHGQPIGRIRFERMMDVPDVLYDAGTSHYSVQSGPRLAKQFKHP